MLQVKASDRRLCGVQPRLGLLRLRLATFLWLFTRPAVLACRRAHGLSALLAVGPSGALNRMLLPRSILDFAPQLHRVLGQTHLSFLSRLLALPRLSRQRCLLVPATTDGPAFRGHSFPNLNLRATFLFI